MKSQFLEPGTRQGHRATRFCFVAAALLAASTPAFAQITKVDTVMTNVQNLLTGIAVTTFTIALLWAGFKMAFQHAKWSEIANIVIGGIITGGASGIASWLIA